MATTTASLASLIEQHAPLTSSLEDISNEVLEAFAALNLADLPTNEYDAWLGSETADGLALDVFSLPSGTEDNGNGGEEGSEDNEGSNGSAVGPSKRGPLDLLVAARDALAKWLTVYLMASRAGEDVAAAQARLWEQIASVCPLAHKALLMLVQRACLLHLARPVTAELSDAAKEAVLSCRLYLCVLRLPGARAYGVFDVGLLRRVLSVVKGNFELAALAEDDANATKKRRGAAASAAGKRVAAPKRANSRGAAASASAAADEQEEGVRRNPRRAASNPKAAASKKDDDESGSDEDKNEDDDSSVSSGSDSEADDDSDDEGGNKRKRARKSSEAPKKKRAARKAKGSAPTEVICGVFYSDEDASSLLYGSALDLCSFLADAPLKMHGEVLPLVADAALAAITLPDSIATVSAAAGEYALIRGSTSCHAVETRHLPPPSSSSSSPSSGASIETGPLSLLSIIAQACLNLCSPMHAPNSSPLTCARILCKKLKPLLLTCIAPSNPTVLACQTAAAVAATNAITGGGSNGMDVDSDDEGRPAAAKAGKKRGRGAMTAEEKEAAEAAAEASASLRVHLDPKAIRARAAYLSFALVSDRVVAWQKDASATTATTSSPASSSFPSLPGHVLCRLPAVAALLQHLCVSASGMKTEWRGLIAETIATLRATLPHSMRRAFVRFLIRLSKASKAPYRLFAIEAASAMLGVGGGSGGDDRATTTTSCDDNSAASTATTMVGLGPSIESLLGGIEVPRVKSVVITNGGTTTTTTTATTLLSPSSCPSVSLWVALHEGPIPNDFDLALESSGYDAEAYGYAGGAGGNGEGEEEDGEGGQGDKDDDKDDSSSNNNKSKKSKKARRASICAIGMDVGADEGTSASSNAAATPARSSSAPAGAVRTGGKVSSARKSPFYAGGNLKKNGGKKKNGGNKKNGSAASRRDSMGSSISAGDAASLFGSNDQDDDDGDDDDGADEQVPDCYCADPRPTMTVLYDSIIHRCSDKSPAVRSRALTLLASLLTTGVDDRAPAPAVITDDAAEGGAGAAGSITPAVSALHLLHSSMLNYSAAAYINSLTSGAASVAANSSSNTGRAGDISMGDVSSLSSFNYYGGGASGAASYYTGGGVNSSSSSSSSVSTALSFLQSPGAPNNNSALATAVNTTSLLPLVGASPLIPLIIRRLEENGKPAVKRAALGALTALAAAPGCGIGVLSSRSLNHHVQAAAALALLPSVHAVRQAKPRTEGESGEEEDEEEDAAVAALQRRRQHLSASVLGYSQQAKAHSGILQHALFLASTIARRNDDDDDGNNAAAAAGVVFQGPSSVLGLYALELLSAKATDPSVLVRKAALTSLDGMLTREPSTPAIQRLWLAALLPSILDPEASVSALAMNAVASRVIHAVAEVGRRTLQAEKKSSKNTNKDKEESSSSSSVLFSAHVWSLLSLIAENSDLSHCLSVAVGNMSRYWLAAAGAGQGGASGGNGSSDKASANAAAAAAAAVSGLSSSSLPVPFRVPEILKALTDVIILASTSTSTSTSTSNEGGVVVGAWMLLEALSRHLLDPRHPACAALLSLATEIASSSSASSSSSISFPAVVGFASAPKLKEVANAFALYTVPLLTRHWHKSLGPALVALARIMSSSAAGSALSSALYDPTFVLPEEEGGGGEEEASASASAVDTSAAAMAEEETRVEQPVSSSSSSLPSPSEVAYLSACGAFCLQVIASCGSIIPPKDAIMMITTLLGKAANGGAAGTAGAGGSRGLCSFCWDHGVTTAAIRACTALSLKAATAAVSAASGPALALAPTIKANQDRWTRPLLQACGMALSRYLAPSTPAAGGGAAGAGAALTPAEERALGETISSVLHVVGELALIGLSASSGQGVMDTALSNSINKQQEAASSSTSSSGGPPSLTFPQPPSVFIPQAMVTSVQALMGGAGAQDKDKEKARAAPIPDGVRAHAVLCLGKLCLRDPFLAKRYVAVLVRDLNMTAPAASSKGASSSSSSSSFSSFVPPVVRNNCLMVLGDLCVRYTSLVDKHLPSLASCIADPHPLLRKHGISLLARLMSQEYVKLRAPLFYRMAIALSDPDESVRRLAQSALTSVLMVKGKSAIASNFVSLLFIATGCASSLTAFSHIASSVTGVTEWDKTAASITNAAASTSSKMASMSMDDDSDDDSDGDGASSSSNKRRKVSASDFIVTSFLRRQHVYRTLLAALPDEQKLTLHGKLCSDVLAAVGDGLMSLTPGGPKGMITFPSASAAGGFAALTLNSTTAASYPFGSPECILADALAVLASPEMRAVTAAGASGAAKAGTAGGGAAGAAGGAAAGAAAADDADDDAAGAGDDGGGAGGAMSAKLAAAAQAAKTRLLTRMVSKHVTENVLPIILSLRHVATTSRSPLLAQVTAYVDVLFTDHGAEIKDALLGQADRRTLAELEFDHRQWQLQQQQHNGVGAAGGEAPSQQDGGAAGAGSSNGMAARTPGKAGPGGGGGAKTPRTAVKTPAFAAALLGATAAAAAVSQKKAATGGKKASASAAAAATALNTATALTGLTSPKLKTATAAAPPAAPAPVPAPAPAATPASSSAAGTKKGAGAGAAVAGGAGGKGKGKAGAKKGAAAAASAATAASVAGASAGAVEEDDEEVRRRKMMILMKSPEDEGEDSEARKQVVTATAAAAAAAGTGRAGSRGRAKPAAAADNSKKEESGGSSSSSSQWEVAVAPSPFKALPLAEPEDDDGEGGNSDAENAVGGAAATSSGKGKKAKGAAAKTKKSAAGAVPAAKTGRRTILAAAAASSSSASPAGK